MVQQHVKARVPAVLLAAIVTSMLGGCGSGTASSADEANALYDPAY